MTHEQYDRRQIFTRLALPGRRDLPDHDMLRQSLPFLACVEPDAYNGGVGTSLPGEELITEGLADLERGHESIPALLVSIGAPRLSALGFRIVAPIPSPERRLYELLARDDPNSAHGRYNALIRRLVSFERAAECAR